jgi:hypothetical protein
MRAVLLSGFVAAGLVLGAVPAGAGVIERACLGSERAGGNRALCGCIQSAANRTLTGSDQRTAAQFFRDPDRAQQVRMSNRARDRAFWERYRAFGTYAERVCASS